MGNEDEDGPPSTPNGKSVDPKVFTPLPSTSKDTVTIDLNDKMFIKIYGREDGIKSAPSSPDIFIDPPSSPVYDNVCEQSLDFTKSDFDDEPPAKRQNLTNLSPINTEDEPIPTLEDIAVMDDVESVENVISVDKPQISQTLSLLDESQNNIIQIDDTIDYNNRTKRKRRSPRVAECEVVTVDSSDDDSIALEEPKKSFSTREFFSKLMKKSRRNRVQSISSSSPQSLLSSPESESDNSVAAFFDPLLSYIGSMVSDDRNENYKILDTVDLSKDSFKPTPVISDVIVIDSDTSVNIESPLRVSRVSDCDTNATEPKLQDCPICLDNFSAKKPIASTFCGHVFCKPCMTVIMKTSRKCPTCRKMLKGKGFHLLYL